MGASTDRVTLASIEDVTAEEWEALASRRIFFGHQSVGRDMIAGVRELLAEHPEIRVRLVESDEPAAVEGAALIEGRIGENRKPETKARAFARVVGAGLGANAIAMYKYCYVDINSETDVDALFDAYVTQAREIERSHPEITQVHITLPLRTVPGGAMERLKAVLGGSQEVALNVKRNRFNERLRQEFGGTAPIFDLALLESRHADGSRAFTRRGSQEVYMLAPEWTYDNGHLNEAGRRYVAEQFLVMLARLSAVRQPMDEPEAAGATGAPGRSN